MTTWIFGLLLPKRDKEMLLGDLVEERLLIESSMGRGDAARWYRRQVLKSCGPVMWANLRRGGWLKTLGAAFAGYCAVAILVMASDVLMSKVLATSTVVYPLVSLAAGCVAMLLGGYLAASMRRGAPAVVAVMAAILGVLSLRATGDQAPVWYQIALIVVGPVAAIAGGRMRRRMRGET